MTLNDLERQSRGFLWIFWPFSPVRVCIIHKVGPRRWRHTRLWPMFIMVPMDRVQMICDFLNYYYWTGSAIGFRASRELCSNFLLSQYRYTVFWSWRRWYLAFMGHEKFLIVCMNPVYRKVSVIAFKVSRWINSSLITSTDARNSCRNHYVYNSI